MDTESFPGYEDIWAEGTQLHDQVTAAGSILGELNQIFTLKGSVLSAVNDIAKEFSMFDKKKDARLRKATQSYLLAQELNRYAQAILDAVNSKPGVIEKSLADVIKRLKKQSKSTLDLVNNLFSIRKGKLIFNNFMLRTEEDALAVSSWWSNLPLNVAKAVYVWSLLNPNTQDYTKTQLYQLAPQSVVQAMQSLTGMTLEEMLTNNDPVVDLSDEGLYRTFNSLAADPRVGRYISDENHAVSAHTGELITTTTKYPVLRTYRQTQSGAYVPVTWVRNRIVEGEENDTVYYKPYDPTLVSKVDVGTVIPTATNTVVEPVETEITLPNGVTFDGKNYHFSPDIEKLYDLITLYANGNVVSNNVVEQGGEVSVLRPGRYGNPYSPNNYKGTMNVGTIPNAVKSFIAHLWFGNGDEAARQQRLLEISQLRYKSLNYYKNSPPAKTHQISHANVLDYFANVILPMRGEMIARDMKFTGDTLLEQLEKHINRNKMVFARGSLNIIEDTATGYAHRTSENAKSDLTLAFATDFSTGGEYLTKQSVLKHGKVYLPITLTREMTPERVDAVVQKLNGLFAGKQLSVNIAGNGIYTLAPQGMDQAKVDSIIYDWLDAIFGHENALFEVKSVNSGGQTGVDEAGIKWAVDNGINSTILAPKGYLFKNEAGTNISDEYRFRARFMVMEPSIEVQPKTKLGVKNIDNSPTISEQQLRQIEKAFGLPEGTFVTDRAEGIKVLMKLDKTQEEAEALLDSSFGFSDPTTGKLYVGRLDLDTPIHESGHLVWQLLPQARKQRFIEVVKDTTEWKDALQEVKNPTDDRVGDEVFARMFSKYGSDSIAM